MITIRELQSSEAVAYKEFFLRALLADGDSFRLSPEDEMVAPFPTENKADSFTLAAFDGDRLRGVVSFAREGKDRKKLRHKGLIFRMYVDPSVRGSGIGKLLMGQVILRARQLPDIEQIALTLVATNERAKRLYQSLGFETYSVEPRAIKNGTDYFDEASMVLFLRTRPSTN